MLHNGPAIKGVSVAERVEAGAEKLSRGRVLPKALTEAKHESGVPARAERLKIALWRAERQ
jgi:hypothetical protein